VLCASGLEVDNGGRKVEQEREIDVKRGLSDEHQEKSVESEMQREKNLFL